MVVTPSLREAVRLCSVCSVQAAGKKRDLIAMLCVQNGEPIVGSTSCQCQEEALLLSLLGSVIHSVQLKLEGQRVAPATPGTRDLGPEAGGCLALEFGLSEGLSLRPLQKGLGRQAGAWDRECPTCVPTREPWPRLPKTRPSLSQARQLDSRQHLGGARWPLCWAQRPETRPVLRREFWNGS